MPGISWIWPSHPGAAEGRGHPAAGRLPPRCRRGRPPRVSRGAARNVEALTLYERCGFAPVGARKRYYSDTGEDALVMMRPAALGALDEATHAMAVEPPTGDGNVLRGPILAIESSCDDSAAAVLAPAGEVLVHRGPLAGLHPRALRRRGARGGQPSPRGADDRRRARGARPGADAPWTIWVGSPSPSGRGSSVRCWWACRRPRPSLGPGGCRCIPVNHLHGHLAAVWLADRPRPSHGHPGGLRRAHYAGRGRRSSYFQAAGSDPGRRRWGGVRQRRAASWARVSGGPGAGRAGGEGRPGGVLVPGRH